MTTDFLFFIFLSAFGELPIGKILYHTSYVPCMKRTGVLRSAVCQLWKVLHWLHSIQNVSKFRRWTIWWDADDYGPTMRGRNPGGTRRLSVPWSNYYVYSWLHWSRTFRQDHKFISLVVGPPNICYIIMIHSILYFTAGKSDLSKPPRTFTGCNPNNLHRNVTRKYL